MYFCCHRNNFSCPWWVFSWLLSMRWWVFQLVDCVCKMKNPASMFHSQYISRRDSINTVLRHISLVSWLKLRKLMWITNPRKSQLVWCWSRANGIRFLNPSRAYVLYVLWHGCVASDKRELDVSLVQQNIDRNVQKCWVANDCFKMGEKVGFVLFVVPYQKDESQAQSIVLLSESRNFRDVSLQDKGGGTCRRFRSGEVEVREKLW